MVRDILFEFDVISTDDDHLHLFIGAELKDSLSIVMQIIKGTIARKVVEEYSEIKKQLYLIDLRAIEITLEPR